MSCIFNVVQYKRFIPFFFMIFIICYLPIHNIKNIYYLLYLCWKYFHTVLSQILFPLLSFIFCLIVCLLFKWIKEIEFWRNNDSNNKNYLYPPVYSILTKKKVIKYDMIWWWSYVILIWSDLTNTNNNIIIIIIRWLYMS